MENMERGEKGGVVLDGDGSGPEENGAEGAIDAAIDQTNKEADKVIDESGGAADSDGRTEVPEDGKVDGEEESPADPASESARPAVNPELETFKAEIKAEIAKLGSQPAHEEAKPLTDEQWGKLEQEWQQPRQTIERITQQNVKVVNRLTEYIDAKFAKLEVGEAIQAVSRESGFTDAPRYRKDVQEFLQDYDPKHWSNPALIKKAVIYARGLNAGTNIQKVRTESERNKKIAGAARPSAPTSGIKKVAAPALNGAHREVAAMMGGDGEYNKWRSRPSRTIE